MRKYPKEFILVFIYINLVLIGEVISQGNKGVIINNKKVAKYDDSIKNNVTQWSIISTTKSPLFSEITTLKSVTIREKLNVVTVPTILVRKKDFTTPIPKTEIYRSPTHITVVDQSAEKNLPIQIQPINFSENSKRMPLSTSVAILNPSSIGYIQPKPTVEALQPHEMEALIQYIQDNESDEEEMEKKIEILKKNFVLNCSFVQANKEQTHQINFPFGTLHLGSSTPKPVYDKPEPEYYDSSPKPPKPFENIFNIFKPKPPTKPPKKKPNIFDIFNSNKDKDKKKKKKKTKKKPGILGFLDNKRKKIAQTFNKFGLHKNLQTPSPIPSPPTVRNKMTMNPTTTDNKSKKKKKKSSESGESKTEYVEPPLFGEIGDVLENIYNFFEEAFTTKIKIVKRDLGDVENRLVMTPKRTSKKPTLLQASSKKPIKSVTKRTVSKNPSTTGLVQSTKPPHHRTTHSVGDPTESQNYLTTKIHVTSSYGGPKYPLMPIREEPSSTESGELYSDEGDLGFGIDDSEEDDDDGDYDYDPYNFYPDDGYDDDDADDDDDDDDGDDDDYNTQIRPPIQPNRIQRPIYQTGVPVEHKTVSPPLLYTQPATYATTSRPITPPTIRDEYDYEEDGEYENSYDDYDPSYDEEEDNDEYDEQEDVSESPNRGIFGSILSTFNGMVARMPRFHLNPFDSGNDEDEQRSTTPLTETKNSKRKNTLSSDNGKNKSFLSDYTLDDYEYDYGEETSIDDSELEISTTTQSSSWFMGNWFGSDEEIATEAPVVEADSSNGNGWFFGLFGNSNPTTTTQKPPIISVAEGASSIITAITNQLQAQANKTSIINSKPRKSYANYQLWNLLVDSEAKLNFLRDYRRSVEGNKLQWWKGPSLRGLTHILIPPGVIEDTKTSLEYENIEHDVLVYDMEKAIKYENPKMTIREKVELELSQGHAMTWHRYHKFGDIKKYLEHLQVKYPDYVETLHIGKSYEGRPLIMIKISTPQEESEVVKMPNRFPWSKSKRKRSSKPIIMIEAGSHAREWIGPAVATWIIDKIVTNMHLNNTEMDTIKSVDWYIIPVLNPDGYSYSYNFDRMWRKTRSRHTEDTSSIITSALNWIMPQSDTKKEQECIGVDLNRNWVNDWGGDGSSHSPCSDFYAGPKAFSEPEAKAMSKLIMEKKKRIKIFISMHSYGQVVTFPTKDQRSSNPVDNNDDLIDMISVATTAMKLKGSERYTIDLKNEMVSPRSGSIDLYAREEAGIRHTYTVDLRDKGVHGFLLPPSYIIATAKESLEMIKAMIDFM